MNNDSSDVWLASRVFLLKIHSTERNAQKPISTMFAARSKTNPTRRTWTRGQKTEKKLPTWFNFPTPAEPSRASKIAPKDYSVLRSKKDFPSEIKEKVEKALNSKRKFIYLPSNFSLAAGFCVSVWMGKCFCWISSARITRIFVGKTATWRDSMGGKSNITRVNVFRLPHSRLVEGN